MKKSLLKKSFGFVIMVLFVGLVVPPISSYPEGEVENRENIFSLKKSTVATTNDILYLYVDDIEGSGPGNPPENYTKIQDAISSENLTSDTIIIVYNGTYNESININEDFILLSGSEPYQDDLQEEGSIINGQREEYVVDINYNDVNIRNFTITNSSNAGINIDDWENIIIENCTLSDTGNYSIFILNAGGCKIRNNTIRSAIIGIYLERGNGNNIYNNVIGYNEWVGIWLWDDSRTNTIKRNNICYNGLCGIVVIFSNGNIINRNNIHNQSGLGFGLVNLLSWTNAKNNWWGDKAPKPLSDYGQLILWDLRVLGPLGLYIHIYPWEDTRIEDLIVYPWEDTRIEDLIEKNVNSFYHYILNTIILNRTKQSIL